MEQLYLFDNLDLTNIFEYIGNISQLRRAFKAVKANKGAPGVDGQTIEEFEENLEEEIKKLSEEIQNWTYRPQPVKRIEIPKPGGAGVRKIGVPCIRDRILQQSIKMSIEWKYEQQFSEASFGFRPGRSQHQAIKEAQRHVKEGYEYVVDIDLEKFFDKIPQDRLMSKLAEVIKDKRILKLIGMTLRSGVLDVTGNLIPSEDGTTQGSPLSPMLSNAYLDELDKELEKREHRFCRFADDCNIFCKSKRAAERVMKSITKFIEKKMKLKVNQKKSKVAKSEKVTFLGITIVRGSIAISKKLIKRANGKVRKLTPRNGSDSIENLIEKVNKWLQGWYEYVKITEYPAQIKKIEAHIRRRLRAKLVKQKQKNKRRYLAKFLYRQGIKARHVIKAVYKTGKIWAISKTYAIEQAFTPSWFKEKGLITPSENKLSHWKDLKKWIVLT